MSYNTEIITTTVPASKIVPMAKQCIKAIHEYQAKENERLLSETIKEFNSKWINRLLRKKITTLKEAEEYEKYLYQNSSHFCFRQWPCSSYCRTEARAEEIIENANVADPNAVYTIPITIYNDIASFCK